MPSSSDDWSDRLEPQVRAFLEAYRRHTGQAPVDLRGFLPPRHDPLYLPVLWALVLFDLELSWQSGKARSLADYRQNFPELFEIPLAVQELSLREFRLRQRAGLNPSPEEYEQQFGVDTRG